MRAQKPPFCVSKNLEKSLKNRTWPRDPKTTVKVVVGANNACPQWETNANFILLLDQNGVFHHFLIFTKFLPPFLSMY